MSWRGLADQVVHDELMLDGNARLNLATFVTTWVEPAAGSADERERVDKNMIDKDEYPRTAELEQRCVRTCSLACGTTPTAAAAIGCSTTGSSEACMLPGWRSSVAGSTPGGRLVVTDRPNLVMGINVQVCWEKFANYFDVEPRLVSRWRVAGCTLPAEEAVLGAMRTPSAWSRCWGRRSTAATSRSPRSARRSTAAGPHRPGRPGARRRGVRSDDRAVLRSGLDAWDFRLPRVASINTSGTSTAWSTRVSAGRSGGTPTRCPTTSCSG